MLERTFIRLAALLVAAIFPVAPALAQSSTTCIAGYTFGFFNGVGNTEVDALNGANALQDAVRQQNFALNAQTQDVYDNEDIKFDVYYNHTGASVGATTLQDVAEVFVQRANELDPGGSLATQFFYSLWEMNSGTGPGYANAAANQNPGFLAMVGNLTSNFETALASLMAQLASSPPTALDYAAQQAQMTVEAAAGRKLVLVAHSQGNLFVNHAYDFIQPLIGSGRVKVVHVAPASPTIRGAYILGGTDAIINALRLVNGFSTIVDPNIFPSPNPNDVTGHLLIETYLSTAAHARDTLQNDILDAFKAMDGSTQTCTVSVTPAAQDLGVADSVALAAALSPPLIDTNVALSWEWKIVGQAGGYFIDPVSGQQATTITTTTPGTTYFSAPDALINFRDAVNVTAKLSAVAAPTTSKDVNSGQAVISIVDNITATLSPQAPTVKAATTTTFSAVTKGNLPTGAVYAWTLAGGGSIGPGNSVVTTVPTIDYAAPVSGTDTLSVAVRTAGGTVLATAQTSIAITPPQGLGFVASNGTACCGGLPPGNYTSDSVPTGGYSAVIGTSQSFIVSWGVSLNGGGGSFAVSAKLVIPANTQLAAGQSWVMPIGILVPLDVGNFRFISDSSDNVGTFSITGMTPLPNGARLATFSFNEASTSLSSTRTYGGSGSFVVPAAH